MSYIEIYVSEYPFEVESDSIYPIERQNEIKLCKNKSVAENKFYVWKLLEYAAIKAKELNFCDIKFYKNPNGKWQCDNFEFSLSHSGNIIAVALSDKPVGIDVELKNAARFEKLSNKILTEAEKEKVLSIPKIKRGEAINKLWTVKEASFKLRGAGAFIPNKIETWGKTFETKTVKSDSGEEYFLTVVSSDLQSTELNLTLMNGVKYGDE